MNTDKTVNIQAWLAMPYSLTEKMAVSPVARHGVARNSADFQDRRTPCGATTKPIPPISDQLPRLFSSGFTVGRALLLVLLLWCFAFTLACRLLSMPEQQNTVNGLADKLLGITRGEISGQFYGHADSVFHKGAGHYQQAAFEDWFTRMRREVAPAGHFHLHEDGVMEIMPWLYFATRTDPRNVTAYTVAAFWLAGEGGRPDLAEEVLNEALRNNPSDYRIFMEKGSLALKEGKYPKAVRCLDAAFSNWPGTAVEDKEEARVDLAEILTYRGILYEIDGQPEKAVSCYREVINMFPGRLQLRERLTALEKNGRAPTPAEQLAGILLFQRRHVCAEDEDK